MNLDGETCLELYAKTRTYLIRLQIGKGFNNRSQGHMALFGQIGSAGQGVGGAAYEPGTGIAWD